MKYAIDDEVVIPLQINGKKRDELKVPKGSEQDYVLELANSSKAADIYLNGKTIRKVIFVKDRILNIVVSD